MQTPETVLEHSESFMAGYDPLSVFPWLRYAVLGNSIHAYVLTVLSFFALWAVLYLARHYLARRLDRVEGSHKADTLTFARSLLGYIHPYTFPLVALYASTLRLAMPGTLAHGLHLVTIAVVTIEIVRFSGELFSYLISRSRGRKDDLGVRSTNNNITALLRIALWIAGLLFVLENAGYNVSTLLTGLGISGIAVALAAQAILGDTFSSFAIALDKPFEVGDAISVDTLQGVVEHIGLKTTRVRSGSGELLVFANSDLTKSRIRNYKRMLDRSVVFQVKVHPATPLAKLRALPELLAGAVREQETVVFQRAHFLAFGDAAYVFELAYSVKGPDYLVYLNAQQAINFRISELLEAHEVGLAYTPLVEMTSTAPKTPKTPGPGGPPG